MEYIIEEEFEYECSEEESSTSQDQEKFVYNTEGQIEGIELGLCKGPVDQLLEMFKDEDIVVWRSPEASI